MGLDALDLVFCLEKQLGIEIRSEEGLAVLFGTAGDIHRYLMAKVQGESRQVPRIARLFKEITDAVDDITGWWRLTNSLDLNRRFRPAKRVASWQALQNALAVTLPPLEHSAGEPYPKVPKECNTVISLSNWIIQNRPERVEWFPIKCERKGKMASRQWSETEVWDILRQSICDALGVKPEAVTHDARMVEDLGMN